MASGVIQAAICSWPRSRQSTESHGWPESLRTRRLSRLRRTRSELENEIIVVRAAHVLDVREGRYVEGASVTIRGDVIHSLGGAPPGARVIDLGDRFLLPGL